MCHIHLLTFVIEKMTDWYSVRRKQVTRNGGRSLFKEGQCSSLSALLAQVYPEYLWSASKFARRRAVRGDPTEIQAQRECIEAIGKELGVIQVFGTQSPYILMLTISQLSDWYGISRKTLANKGARRILQKYPSRKRMLETLYPEFKWSASLFTEKSGRVPTGFMKDMRNQRELLERIRRKLGIQQVSIIVLF